MEISLRYTPVTGRLHTRYAPVRRSSAQYCYRLLPLDLHVLGLPLAFILSQDQTLHCKNCFFTFLTHLRVLSPASAGVPTHAIPCLNCFKQRSLFINRHLLSQKRMQRYEEFSNYQNFFSSKNQRKTQFIVLQYQKLEIFFQQK